MPVRKAKYSVLLVTGALKGAVFLSDMFDPGVYGVVTRTADAGAARGMLAQNAFDIVIVNAPLEGESGEALARFAAGSRAETMLLASGALYGRLCRDMRDTGVLVMEKPLSRQSFFEALRLVTATRGRLRTLESENQARQDKMEEVRLVERAKWTLIQVLNMTESQAHRYIEKQAMDMRSTKKTIALGILKTYES